MVHKEHWKDEPDEHDYPAARNYLGLVTTDENAQAFATALALVPIVRRYAKDLLRASQLPALSDKNYHVAKDLRKVGKGQRLSPVLLVAGDFSTDTPLTIADGYHRICATTSSTRMPSFRAVSSMWEKSPMSPQAEGRHQEARRRLQGAGRGRQRPGQASPVRPGPVRPRRTEFGQQAVPGHIGHMP